MPLSLPAALVAAVEAGMSTLGQIAEARRRRRAETALYQEALDRTLRPGLRKGRLYAIQIAVDPREASWGGPDAPSDLAASSLAIAHAYERLGWLRGDPQLLPQVRDSDHASRFLAGEPAEWVWSAFWGRDEASQVGAPSWATMTMTYPIPGTP